MCLCAQVDAAFEIFDSLQGRGMRPSSRTYNALMGACVRGGQWARAFEVYSTMQLRGAPVGVTTPPPLVLSGHPASFTPY